MGLERECIHEKERRGQHMKRKRKIPKCSSVVTVLKKFLVNEKPKPNPERFQDRKNTYFCCTVCCQPIHSEKKKKTKQSRHWYISGKNSWSIFERNLSTPHKNDSQHMAVNRRPTFHVCPVENLLWDRTWRWEPET